MKIQNTFLNILFYLSVLLFFLGFNFTDSPPSGWYLQTLPNLNGKQINDIIFLDSLNGLAVARQTSDSSYILKTTNGGDNWTILYRSFLAMVKIQFININTGYAVGAYLFKTTNGGFNWNQVTAPPISPENLYVLNEDTIWIISSESMTGGVFRTTNGGLNWTQQPSGSGNPDKIYMYNARIGFIVDNTGTNNLRKTTDGGDSWFTVVSGQGFYDMKFIDSLTGWRAKDYIKKTTDGGLTWIQQTLPTGIPGHQIVWGMRNFSVINKDSLWGGYSSVIFPNLQYRGVLYRTTNGGNNWYYQIPDTTLNVPLYNYISFINKNIGWGYTLNSTVNRGIHTTTGGDTTFLSSITQIATELPKNYKLYQNYPNPFNPITKIKFNILKSADINIKVFDITGKEVAILLNERIFPGTYETTFEANKLPSGMYFYSLIVDGKIIDTKKAMLIK
ncbi:MAG: YCF48-related protein [Ignavibacteriae bacterium]|nr:YCF48-related protein [Ignavibacteriota bacterium]